MLPPKNNEQIDAYLSGDNTPEERRGFEQATAADPQLAGEVTLWQNVDEALGDEPTLDFQQTVAKVGKDYLAAMGSSQAKVRRLGVSRRLLSIAAAVLVLVASSVLIWQLSQGSPVNGQELYAANFTPYEITPEAVRSTDLPPPPSGLTKGLIEYQDKQYAAAATTFESLLPAYKDSMNLVFTLANAYLNQQPARVSLAATQLQRVIADGQSTYVPRAQWYLALIRVKEGDLPAAKALLEDVISYGGETGKQAEALLKSL